MMAGALSGADKADLQGVRRCYGCAGDIERAPKETRDQTADSGHRTAAAATTPTCEECGSPLAWNGEWYVWKCPNGHDDPQDPRLNTRAALRDLVMAAGRMLDDYAEASDDRKRELWRNLHEAGDRGREVLGGI